MDVRPSATEILIPFISILTVVGIIPFIAAAARQLWVRYKITSRRISIQGGFQVSAESCKGQTVGKLSRFSSGD